MTVTYNFGVGHWFSPYMGLRLNALGGVLHWNNPTEPNNGWVSARHVNLNLEFMWDLCNSFAGVNPDRVVSVIPFVVALAATTLGILKTVAAIRRQPPISIARIHLR